MKLNRLFSNYSFAHRFLTLALPLALAVILLLASSVPAFADYLIAQESGPNTSGAFATMGQSFTTISAGQVTQIDVYMGAMNGRATDLRIYSGGQQPNNPAVALYVQTGISVNCDNCWFSIPLTTPLDVSSATLYTFEFINWNARYSGANPYSGGTAWQDNISFASIDFAFRVHVREAGLALTKVVNPSSAKPGEVITYTIAFSNTSAVTVTNVIITDTLSIHITNPSWSSNGVTLTPIAGQTYAWTAPELLQGEGGVITITGVLTKPLAAGVFTNTVTLAVSGTVQTADAPLTVENVTPVADAGIDQTKNVSSTVTLNGSGSNDDNSDTLTYGWAQTSGSPLVILSNPAAQSPTFTTPSAATVLTFTLTVTDTGGLTDTDEVVITVFEGTPGYASAPTAGSTINVGQDKVGVPVTATLTISETGNAALNVTGLELTGPNAAEFSVLPTSFSIVDGGAIQTVNIVCTPAGYGLRTATLMVNHNAAGSPATYMLNCTGQSLLYLPLIIR